jgi:hypothetical protein
MERPRNPSGPRKKDPNRMTTILDNPAHWIERAEEARTIADEIRDPESKKIMLEIAEGYERLAVHARRRLGKSAD